MSYSNHTDHYAVPYMADGDVSSSAEEAKLARAFDENLYQQIVALHGSGVLSGWTLNGAGQATQASAGSGFIAGCYCATVAAQTVTGITNSNTNYIMARKGATSPWDKSVSFVAQLSATPPADGVLLGSWVIDGAGAITAVDNTTKDMLHDAADLDAAIAASHAATNDPTPDQKAALAGTSGAPSAANPYVTDADSRLEDARTPVAHQHAGSEITSGTIDAARLSAAGADTQVQFNDGGSPAGDPGLTFNKATDTLCIGGNVGIGVAAPSISLDIARESTTDTIRYTRYGGSASGGGSVNLRGSRGTIASPSGVQSADLLGGLYAGGHGATAFSANVAAIRMNAAENFTDAANGTFIDFATTAIGAAARTVRVVIDAAGRVGVGVTTPASIATSGALDVQSTTGALIVPRMTTTQREALTAVNGMVIYNTTTNAFNFYENGAWVVKADAWGI